MNVTLGMHARKKPNFTKITRSKEELFGRVPSSKVDKNQASVEGASGEKLSLSPLVSKKKHPPGRKAWGLLNVTVYLCAPENQVSPKSRAQKRHFLGAAPAQK